MMFRSRILLCPIDMINSCIQRQQPSSIRLGTTTTTTRRWGSSGSLLPVTEQHLQHLNDMVPILSKNSTVTDWTKHYQARHTTVLQPTTVDQICHVLQYCHKHSLGITPRSGNTGLVGGSVPIQDHSLVLDCTRLNQIVSLQHNGILTTQAGAILQTLQEYSEDKQYLLPIDLGSKGSCCIGGNVATNAGGGYYYRYGSIAANLLGLQVVTATGDVLDLNYSTPNLKDNTGYKLHQLFVGSEGTLGVITGVVLQCRPLLMDRQTAVVCCSSFDDVLSTMDTAVKCLGESLAALEYMDGAVVDLVSKAFQLDLKLEARHPHYLLLEIHGSNSAHNAQKLEQCLEEFASSVVDGVLASDLKQQNAFWNVRESCNPAVGATGYTYKYDVSIPGSQFQGFIESMRERLDGLNVIVTNWGHVLDGNLHFNVTTPGLFQADLEVQNRLEPFLFERVLDLHGSISAEHGIGQAKKQYQTNVHDASVLDLQRSLKLLFDPHGILNPGKLLPD